MEEILGNTMNTGRNSNQTNQFFIKFNICLFVLYILFYRMKGKLASKRRVAAVRHFSRIAFVRSFSGFVGRLKVGLAGKRVSIMLAVQGSTNTR